MAKPRKTKRGIWTLGIQFAHMRRNLTLGKIETALANSFAANVDLLVTHRKTEIPITPQLEVWCSDLCENHYRQLAELGLIDEYTAGLTVQQLIDRFLADYEGRTDIAHSTKIQFMGAMKRFPSFFLEKQVSDLEPKKSSIRRFAEPQFSNDARKAFTNVESWQRERFSKSTWSKANGRIKEVGCWAVARGLCDFNPFTLLPKPGEVGEIIEIPAQTVLDAMANCIDPDTRLLFVLGRFAGIRVPKEARTLKPQHINWEKKTLQIVDAKKKEPRTMPLFPILEEELRLHQSNSEWERFVLSNRTLSRADANNYNLMKEAVVRAGYEPWADLRRNLRSSAINDFLAAGHPEHKVVAWVGHTVATSRKHYQKQTAESIRRDAESMSDIWQVSES